MLRKIRLAAVSLLLLMLALLAADFIQSLVRLNNVVIEGEFNKEKVVSDGEDSIVLTVRVTENGQPRVNDTLQAWLQPGNGLMIPEWAYTDENGEVEITFTPNPATAYDLKTDSIINVIDINIGRWLEVDKRFSIEVPVEIPLSSD
ncbi:MAG: Ig-like domain-containing protein [Caldilineaceae bacterium]|nr:Ig-like domain-containing protein [Caldilineaceae bacterium]